VLDETDRVLAPMYAFLAGFVMPAGIEKMTVDEPVLRAIGVIIVTARPTTVGARSSTFVVGVELD